MLKLFITDLSAYNQGHLIGKWVSLPLEEHTLDKKAYNILEVGTTACKSKFYHEELFITDFEWDNSELMKIEEYSDIYEINEKLTSLEEEKFSEDQLKAVAFLLENGLVKDFNEAIEKHDNVIIHENTSMEEIAYDFIRECYDLDSIPEILSNHIDYEAIGRDLEIEGSFFKEGNDIFEYCD